jgi:hypothetical protein
LKDGTKIAVKVLSDIVKGDKNDSNQELIQETQTIQPK